MTEPRWRRYLRLWGADPRADVSDEMSFHLEQLTREYVAEGATPHEAARRARERFGDYAAYEQSCLVIDEETMRTRRRRTTFDALWQDVRFGLRQLRATSTVTLTALLTLALGIGATTAIFSVVNAVLLRPLPYNDVDRLMGLQMSVPEFRELRGRQTVFEELTIWASNRYSITDEPAEDIHGAIVEPAFFSILMEPSHGRGFTQAEAHASVAVISDALWSRRFNRAPDVLGRKVSMSGRTYDIVGVMPSSFQYPTANFDIWVPFAGALAATPEQAENRLLRIFRVVARRRPEVAQETVAGELSMITREWEGEYSQSSEGRVLTAIPLTQQLTGDVRPRLLMLLGAVGFVLLISCVNVANLLLGATARRGRELAVRRALGAPGTRIVRQLLTESVVLGLVGAALGIAVAALMLHVAPDLMPGVPRINEASLDGSVLAFSIGLALLTALLFGTAPAIRASATDVRGALGAGGRSNIGSRGGGVLRGTLVAAEIAIAVVVLVGAGLLVHSLIRVLDQDTGIDVQGLSHANVGLFYFDDSAEQVAKLGDVLDRVARLDGVIRVAASSGLPPQTAQRATGFSVLGRAPDATEQNGAYWVGITPGYFATVGGAVVRGRDFEASDRAGTMPVTLLSEGLARALFGEADPLGRQIRLTNPDAGDDVRTVVGVVSDIRYTGVEQPPEPTIYTPFAQTPFMWAYLMIRSRPSSGRLAGEVRESIAGVDPRMAPARIVPHEEIISTQVAQRKSVTTLLGGFAALALVLAAAGVYGVTAAAVIERRRDIGLRMALGAPPVRVLTEVIGRALILALAGIGAGIVAALWLTRLLSAMLYEVQPRDALTFGGGILLMITIAVLASCIPAWRASRLDPVRTLREQ